MRRPAEQLLYQAASVKLPKEEKERKAQIAECGKRLKKALRQNEQAEIRACCDELERLIGGAAQDAM